MHSHIKRTIFFKYKIYLKRPIIEQIDSKLGIKNAFTYRSANNIHFIQQISRYLFDIE